MVWAAIAKRGQGFDLLVLPDRCVRRLRRRHSALDDREFVLLDIGANIGLYSLLAAAGPKCRGVHAFEPNPAVFEALRENIRLNGARIEAHRAAVSDGVPGTRTLRVPPHHSGAGSFRHAALDAEQASSVTVDVVGRAFLDGLAAEIEHPVLCKVDVEGDEVKALQELFASAIADRVCGVIVEVAASHHGDDAAQLDAVLTGAGFGLASTSGPPEHYDAYWTR